MEGLRYLYKKNNGNLSICKEKKKNKPLISMEELYEIEKDNENLFNFYQGNYGKFIALKEGIYRLKETRYCNQYFLVKRI
jgi:hypothetical protein